MSRSSRRAVLAVPANNTTMEPELRALCPDLAPVAVARVALPAGPLTTAELPAYTERTFAAIAPFLAERPDVVIHGCTAASFLLGRPESERIVEALRTRSGATVVSTGSAMLDVLAAEGVRLAAVVTPYLDDVNEGLRNYLASAGIAVEGLNSFACETLEDLGRITEGEVIDLALATVTPTSQALFIACSQLPTLGVVRTLRERLGIPVWSSVSATAWQVNRSLTA